MQFFRNFFKSRFGVPISLGFVALIAFAFAAGDLTNTGGLGGVSADDDIAVVGDSSVTAQDLRQAANNAVESMRQQDPTVSLASFIEQNGLEDALDQLIERAAISGFSEKYGLRAGENLVNSEILKIPAFRGADGNFNKAAYDELLASKGMRDSDVRRDLGQGLIARQLLVPASFGAISPASFARRYASLLKETREGAIAVLPAASFAPKADPSDKVLTAFYTANRGKFIRPERRVIRYTTFGVGNLGDKITPTEAEIAASYKQNAALYAASEKRAITQLIVPTKQAAEAITAKVRGGGSLENAAKEAGLSVSKIKPSTEKELSAQTSPAVAKAVFAASSNGIIAPAKSGLGYHVVRLDTVDKNGGKSLEQARAEISAALAVQKKRQALVDLAASIEDELADGATPADIAKKMKGSLTQTKPITGDGMVFGSQGETAPQELAPVLKTAFMMEENDPEVLEIVPGETFMVYEVAEITQSAAAPLAEIKEQAKAVWKMSEGARFARAAGDRILARVAKGSTLTAAIAAEKISLPAVDKINMTREELAKTGQRIPPALALLFSMAQGTTKKLEAPQGMGYFVISLSKINTGELAKADPILVQTAQEISASMGREYSDQLRKAIIKDQGEKRNKAALAQLRKQMTGAR